MSFKQRNTKFFTSIILLLSVGIGMGQYTISTDVEKENKLGFSDFSQPQNMGAPLNAPEMDQLPALAPSGLSLYFSSNRPGGQSPCQKLWKLGYASLLFAIFRAGF